MREELERTHRYWRVAELHGSQQSAEEIAKQLYLDADLLTQWAKFLDLDHAVERKLTGHLQKKLTNVAGYEAISGWATNDLPVLLANSSDEPIHFSTLTVPARGVTVHPTPNEEVAVAWRSPFTGTVSLTGKIADGDGNCGNGAAWRIELLSQAGPAELISGVIDNGRDHAFAPQPELAVREGTC